MRFCNIDYQFRSDSLVSVAPRGDFGWDWHFDFDFSLYLDMVPSLNLDFDLQ